LSRFLLVRHAHHGLVGKALAGRKPGIRLDAAGRAQADRLAQRLAELPIAAIYTSPQDRARETAAPLAAHVRLTPRIEPAIDEIEFGEWTGKTFAELASDAQWPVWVDRRSIAQPPNGERFEDVQKRAVEGIDRLRAAHREETVVLVSHGDVIKAILARSLKMSLDDLERFDIAPASVSVLAVGDNWSRVERLNDTGELP
jgi:probable phosphomutase (TIGR03848 family)